jgi:hypothetical protein
MQRTIRPPLQIKEKRNYSRNAAMTIFLAQRS